MLRRPGYLLTIVQRCADLTVSVYGSGGNLAATVTREFSQEQGEDRGLDPDELFASALTLMDTVLRRAGLKALDVTHVGVAAPSDTVVFWDMVSGVPLGPVAAITETSQPGRERVGLFLKSFLGHPQRETRFRGAHAIRCGSVDSWLLWNLTQGAFLGIDPGHELAIAWNETMGDYDPAWLSEYGLDAACLPRVVASVGEIATVSPVYLNGVGAKVTAIVRSEAAAMFGVGLLPGRELWVRYGSAGHVLLRDARDEIPADADVRSLLRRADQVTVHGYIWRFHAPQAVMAWLYRMGTAGEDLDLEALTGESRVWVVPNRTMPDRADILGVGPDTTAGSVREAAWRAAAFAVRSLSDVARGLSVEPIEAICTDRRGFATSAFFHFQSMVCGLPLRVYEEDCDSVGTMLLAGWGAGMWDERALAELASRLLNPRVFEPDPAGGATASAFERWNEFVRAVE